MPKRKRLVGYCHKGFERNKPYPYFCFVSCDKDMYKKPRNQKVKIPEIYKYKDKKFPRYMYSVKVAITIEELPTKPRG